MKNVKLHTSRTLIARGLGFVTTGGWLRVCTICGLFLQRYQGFQQHLVRHGSQHGDRDTSDGLASGYLLIHPPRQMLALYRDMPHVLLGRN